jgi:hypothetical protein
MSRMYPICPKHHIPAVGAHGKPHKYGKCYKCRQEENAEARDRSRTRKAIKDTPEAKAARQAAGEAKRKVWRDRQRRKRIEKDLTKAYRLIAAHPEFKPSADPDIHPQVPMARTQAG